MKDNDIIKKLMDSHFLFSKRFYGGIIVLAFLIVLTSAARVQKNNNNDVQAGGSYAEESESSGYRELLTTYYDGLASGDIEKVLSVAEPVSDSEKSYIEFLSGYVESYDIDEIYTKQGIEDGSSLLSARVGIHFKDLNSAAPGLDFFYVQTRDDGSLYINNLYSTYNQENNENPMDPDVSSLIAQFEQQEDVLALQADIQAEYNQLLLSDSDFNTFTTDTLPGAVQEWAKNYNTLTELAAKKEEQEQKEALEKLAKAAEEKEKEEKKKAEEEKKKQEEEKKAAAEEQEEKESEDTTYKVVTNANVNLRKKPTTDSDSLGKVDSGTTLTAYKEKDGWTKVKYGDDKGWIRNDFVDKKDGDDDGDTAADTSLYGEGEKVTLSGTVNVRESMSESAAKVAVAYAGTTVEVIMMYEEGWTKVKIGDETGYIKSEYLK